MDHFFYRVFCHGFSRQNTVKHYAGRAYRLSFWRTAHGAEVDYVLETPTEVIPIEVKATESPALTDASHLKLFLETYPLRARRGFIVCRCRTPRRLSKNIEAVPWWGGKHYLPVPFGSLGSIFPSRLRNPGFGVPGTKAGHDCGPQGEGIHEAAIPAHGHPLAERGKSGLLLVQKDVKSIKSWTSPSGPIHWLTCCSVFIVSLR